MASQLALVVKNPPAKAGDVKDTGLISGLGRSPGEGKDNPLQYSCLENPMDRDAWQATVHRVAKNWTRLKQRSVYMHGIWDLVYPTRNLAHDPCIGSMELKALDHQGSPKIEYILKINFTLLQRWNRA